MIIKIGIELINKQPDWPVQRFGSRFERKGNNLASKNKVFMLLCFTNTEFGSSINWNRILYISSTWNNCVTSVARSVSLRQIQALLHTLKAYHPLKDNRGYFKIFMASFSLVAFCKQNKSSESRSHLHWGLENTARCI